MAITVEQTTAEVHAFFQDLQTAAQNQIAQQNLPLIGAVPAIPTGAVFQALEAEVARALDALDPGASAAEIAVALSLIEIDGMHPIIADVSGDAIDITIAQEVGLNLTEKPFDLGGTVAGVGLELDGEFVTKLTAELDVKLRLDSSGQLQVRDSTNPELAVGLDASLSLDGEGKLGFLTITATDKDPNQPEVELDLGIDLASGDAGGLVATAAPPTVRAGLDLTIEAGVGDDTDEETGIPFSILPSISTELLINYSAIDDTTPSIAFNDITVDVRSIYGILQQALKPIAKVLDTEPLGTILDLATGPVPILDDLAPFLDTLPSLTNGDGVVSLADIAVWQSKLQGADPNVFFEVVSLLGLVRNLGLPSENQNMGSIVLGNLAFSDAANPGDLKSTFVNLVGGSGLDELDSFLKDSRFLDTFGDDASDHFSLIPGLEIPLLEDPSEIVGLLFNAVYDPVTLVTYDLPELSVRGGFSLQIPILGPIAVKFAGNAGASIDLKIGYDTKAFEEAVGGAPFAFEDGFFFDATEPLASLTAELTASAGFDALVLSAWATGGIHFAISASLDNKDGDDKVRLGELSGCFVHPITGKAWADVTVDVEIDFGLFSVSESIPIASVTLAEFDLFECPPPRMPTSPPNQGLATLGGLGVPTELVLNVGDRASERVITEDGESKQIPGENEFYFIGLAREPATNEGPFPSTQEPGAIIPDAIDVSAFGYTQHYGSAAAPVTSIRANFGSQNDSLVIAEEITLESHISGGEGNEFMSGGSGRDFFSGDNGDDYLVGKKGDDVLEGGALNDTLDGGEGADAFRGGTGRDKVTYANANKTTGEGVTIFWDESAGKLTAKGGEANGDTFDSIEYLVGTSFNDTLVGNPFLFLTEPGLYNTLEGGDGNDLLIGAEVTGDFLMGGRGADTIDGKSGIDGTTYVTSVGGVYIDLGARVFLLGDAEGDNLISIENVQGSSSNDAIYGDGANNEIDGFVGDDWLSGGGGKDKVTGSLGNDTIFAFADGDTLDGGGTVNDPGKDLLTYRAYTGAPVTVNLRPGGGAPDTIVGAVRVDGSVATGYSTFENLEGTNLEGTGDNLTGDDGNNTIWGLKGNDSVNGGAGDDTLVGGAGADALNGGTGVDWADYRSSPGGVVVSLFTGTGAATGTGIAGDAAGDTLVLGTIQGNSFRLNTIENLRGSDFADALTGDDGDNKLDPGLTQRTTGQFLFFGDFVSGGGGTDTLVVDYARGDVGKGVVGGFGAGSTTSGSLSREQGTTDDALDGVFFDNVEQLDLVGTIKGDVIYGGQGNDKIETLSGNDVIVSGLGSDFVRAGDGDDFVALGTNANRQLAPIGGNASQFFATGESGIDTYSLSLGGRSEDISFFGFEPTGTEFHGVNFFLPDGTAITDFEILQDLVTGSGNDFIFQPGDVDNSIVTGEGSDIIVGSLGTDFVSGGRDSDNNLALFQGELYLTNEAQFFNKQGDVLIVNYSDLANGQQVVSSAERYETDINVKRTVHVGPEIGSEEERLFAVNSTMGSYRVTDSSGTVLDRTDFIDIERIIATGSDGDDILVGTYSQITNVDVPSTLRGDDDLTGGDGNDTLLGITGSDTLHGGAGNDMLLGTSFQSLDENFGDQTEVDTLFGDTGADTFVLGTSSQRLYQSGDSRAIIMDFSRAEGDRIQLRALTAEETADTNGYIYEQTGSTVVIEYGFVNNPAFRDVVAEIRNYVGTFDANLDVSFVAPSSGFTAFAASASANAFDAFADNPSYVRSMQALAPDETMADAAGLAPASAATTPVSTLASAGGFTVNRNNDVGTLLTELGTISGASNVKLTIDGNADATGTFSGDPFGLGSGIVISTGQVEDLVGPNTDNGGSTPDISIPLTFVKIGRVGETDIFRADLSGLGIDINSLTLRDSKSHVGGGSASDSGFDVDSVMLSRTLLAAVDSPEDLNVDLPKLDVFDFSAASTVFHPGTQRSPVNPAHPNLSGSIEFGDIGLVLDASHLGRVDADGVTDLGNLTLGDGGSLAFNLTSTVSTDGPLYLYVGEDGASGEALEGLVSVSSGFIEPEGDLSSDLGTAGIEGDTTKMTYAFTPDAGLNTIQFQFVLFSEELPEFAGAFPTDTFKIKLNGVDYAALSDGSAASLNNLMATTSGPTHPDLVLNPPGTGPASDLTRADAYTTVITFTGQVTAGVENVLELEVADGRDAFLDSGILIKGGSLHAIVDPTIRANGGGSADPLVEGGHAGVYHVERPAGVPPTDDVTVTLTPSDNIELGGNGPGKPISVTFTPGGPNAIDVPVRAVDVPGEEPRPGRVDGVVTSDDPRFDGQQLAPQGYEIVKSTNLAPEIIVPHGTGYFDAADHSGGYLLRNDDGTFYLHDVNSDQVTGHLVGAVGTEWRFIGTGDFNGNGVSDILSVRDSDNMLHIHTMGGNQVVAAGLIGQVGSDWNILGIGDFNNDGTDDILSQRDGDGMLHLHQINSTQVAGSSFIGQIGTDWDFLATGDFNNDGTSDILWQRDGDGTLLIHNVQSNQVVGNAVLGQIGSELHFVGIGDFNGDQTDDLLWQRDDASLLIYNINNNQLTDASIVETLPADTHVAGIGNFTGDGTDDLVLRHDDGTFQLQQIQNNLVASTVTLGQVGNEWLNV